jgi:hypothetical protein
MTCWGSARCDYVLLEFLRLRHEKEGEDYDDDAGEDANDELLPMSKLLVSYLYGTLALRVRN